jgi:Tfp pilus assembly protein PilO
MSDLNLSRHLRKIDAAAMAYCLMISAVAYFAVIAPSTNRREEQARQQSEIAELRAQLDQTAKFQKQLSAQLITRQAELERTAVQLEPASSVNHRLSSLTQIASGVGIALDAIEPGTQNNASDFSRVPIRLSGKGSYAASARFLSQLKQRFPDTAVGSMRLTSDPAAPDVSPSVWFDLVWYAAPEGSKRVTSAPEK